MPNSLRPILMTILELRTESNIPATAHDSAELQPDDSGD